MVITCQYLLVATKQIKKNFIELIRKESLPMYEKFTKFVDNKKCNYKNCDIKDVRGANKL
jgi:hypothetical protein